MDNYRNNSSYSSRAQAASASRASTVRLSGNRSAGANVRRTGDVHAAGSQAASAVRPARRTNFMRYANDNAVVRAIYNFTTGATKPLFIVLVVVAVLVGVYPSVRDYYCAQRSNEVLAKQVELRKEYNKKLEKEVNSLLSEEGVKDRASKDLGLVMPGEKTIDVVDDDDSSSDSKKSSKSSSEPSSLSELEKAEQAVVDDAPWYTKALDTLFGFTGVAGQEVASTGK